MPMSTEDARCPKCSHQMERGYVADIGYGYLEAYASPV
jgi:hypothetical protein